MQNADIETRLAGRPLAKAFRRIDFLIPLTMQCTMVPPMSLVLEERARAPLATTNGAQNGGWPVQNDDSSLPRKTARLATSLSAFP